MAFDNKAHLFLSYPHRDNERLFPLHAALERGTGHYIWIDKEELTGGIEWENSIHAGIEDCYGIIFAITSTFFTRPFIVKRGFLQNAPERSILQIRWQRSAKSKNQFLKLEGNQIPQHYAE